MARRADYVHRVAVAAMTTEEREAHEAEHRADVAKQKRFADVRAGGTIGKAHAASEAPPEVPAGNPFVGARRVIEEHEGPGLAVAVPAKRSHHRKDE